VLSSRVPYGVPWDVISAPLVPRVPGVTCVTTRIARTLAFFTQTPGCPLRWSLGRYECLVTVVLRVKPATLSVVTSVTWQLTGA
jgi:hypothetical protein